MIALLLLATSAAAQDHPRVVAVNYALAFMAERLVGDAAEVSFPVPQGVDPSFWRPSVADISAIQSADLIVLNGAGFAAWVDRVSLPRSRVVDTSRGLEDAFIITQSVTHTHGEGGAHSHEGLVSYLWLDPALAAAQAEALAGALTRSGLPPAEGALDVLQADLAALGSDTTASLTNTAPIIATHPRYQYFARRFGLTISALDWEAGTMPTPDQLAALKKQMSQTGAQVLIWEATPPAEALEATKGLGLRNVIFPPLARRPDDGDFLTAYRASMQKLSNALR